MPDRARLGELLVERGLITRAVLDYALAQQRLGGFRQRVGEILVEIDAASARDILAVVCEQIASERFSTRLGDLLIARGIVSPAEVAAAADTQALHGGLFGEILVDSGALTPSQLGAALDELHASRLGPAIR